VRKLREMRSHVRDSRLHTDIKELLQSHEATI
jgi:hypothetical protein